MTPPLSYRIYLSFLVCAIGGVAVSASGCIATDAACGNKFDPDRNQVGDFGSSEAALQTEALLEATIALDDAAIEVEADLLATCLSLAEDLGIPSAELAPSSPTESELQSSCARVASEIQDILSSSLPADATLTLVSTPPVCDVDLQFAADCAAACDVAISGEAEVMCTGDLVGSCSADCTGHCVVNASANCEGSCSGTCTGSCTGSCFGTCDGTCSAVDAEGNCKGTCDGMCTGVCTATCDGSCSGRCTAEVMGACEGECRGSCSAEWEAACDGYVDVMAEADCRAACEAEASATAVCTDPQVAVALEVVGDPTARARLDTLAAALDANWANFVKIQSRLEDTLVPALQDFTAAVQGATSSLASAGVSAVSCLAQASNVAVASASRISVSVNVTVTLGASVMTSGGV